MAASPTPSPPRPSPPNAARRSWSRLTDWPAGRGGAWGGGGGGVGGRPDAAGAGPAIDAMLTERRFGEAGTAIVVEEFLEGEEASFFALVDGATALPLASAKDYKP